MSGIKVTSATYSLPSGSSSVDVTNAVISNIKDGHLVIPSISPASFNVSDPAPGQPKVLQINYSINGGSSLTKSVNDGDYLEINAPPQRIASGLEIQKAEYGYTGNYTDVTDAVKNYLSDGTISLTVGFKNVGIPDPNPNKQKELRVRYSINGAQSSQTVKDGEVFKISAPAIDAPSGKSPKQHVLSAAGAILSGISYFMLMFFYLLNFFACTRVSLNWFNTIIPGVAVGVLPLSFLWAVLPILFFRRIVFSTNALTEWIKKPIGGYYLQYV
jgi:hypothetical protein